MIDKVHSAGWCVLYREPEWSAAWALLDEYMDRFPLEPITVRRGGIVWPVDVSNDD